MQVIKMIMMSHSVNNNTCMDLVCLFVCSNSNPLICLIPIPPESPQILDTYSVVAHQSFVICSLYVYGCSSYLSKLRYLRNFRHITGKHIPPLQL